MIKANLHHVELILLADDDADDCMFFADSLAELNLSIKLVSVNDGETAMNWLNTTDKIPDIIFLDMNMPCKNGGECLAEIKEIEHLKHVPIVIISTSLDENIIKSLHKGGALFFIKKPNLFGHLKLLIAEVIELVSNGDTNPSTLEKFVLTVENK